MTVFDFVLLDYADYLNSGQIAYGYLPKKPSLNLEMVDQSSVLAF
jgi:hypothetical protein